MPREGEGGELVVVKCPLLDSYQAELSVLAGKNCLVHGLLQYTGDIMRQIREAWETILLEMDTKLASYAENNPPGTVDADFLDLQNHGLSVSQAAGCVREEGLCLPLQEQEEAQDL